jgi:hypothetical protein
MAGQDTESDQFTAYTGSAETDQIDPSFGTLF